MSNFIKADCVVYNGDLNSLDNTSKLYMEQGIYDVYNKKEEILNEATEQAGKIIEEARSLAEEQIQEERKLAYEEGKKIGEQDGYQDGYKTGIENAQGEINKSNEKIVEDLYNSLEIIENEKDSLIERYEENIKILVYNIVEKIVGYKLDVDKDVVPGIIKKAVKDYKNAEWMKIYISAKDDGHYIQADKELTEVLMQVAQNVKFEISDDLNKGDCVIETGDGQIDAGVSMQLSNLKEIISNI